MAHTYRPPSTDIQHETAKKAYLPYTPTLRQRQKAYAFSRNSYVHSVKLFGDKNRHDIQISAKVYSSQRKSEKPHLST
ncbi:hypothetical protein KUTeg_011935 [Tegillarca granosa]|uniref:Uncharacterized protein n=1 Tax=Tegillarca granosa TaxID=220873 RepID=A0ABQ9EY48_TEGGR|nr:hypothetical protein KUTeg_011935 [Tegillarca granosa]